MCNSTKKTTGKSGDDITAKCRALCRSLVQMEEGDILLYTYYFMRLGFMRLDRVLGENWSITMKCKMSLNKSNLEG